MTQNSAVKTRIRIEENEGEFALGIILTDQLLFSKFFQHNDLSMEPTVPQKLMFCDQSNKILLCTSRNVAKSVSIIGRVVRDAVTFMPREGSREDEILVFAPAEAHLQPLAQRIFALLSRYPVFRYLISKWNRSTDKPLLETKNGLKIHFRIDGCLTGDTRIVDARDGMSFTLEDMMCRMQPDSIFTVDTESLEVKTADKFTIKRSGIRPVYRLTLGDGASIRATSNHPFYTPSGWKPLDEISVAELVADMTEHGLIRFMDVRSVEYVGEEETYDLEVPGCHNFIANGILVHNSSGTDTNMVALHPHKIYGDECEFTNFVTHRSRGGGIQPGGTWLYAGVPNGVRSTPFYGLDQGKEGKDWSKHKCSMLTANPLFMRSAKYRREKIAMFGGRHSPDYITQILGEWGDESISSFPPTSLSFNKTVGLDNGYQYFHKRIAGNEIAQWIKDGQLWARLRIPSVRCLRAVIGWDYGQSPDPTTFIIAIQVSDTAQWQTYCRVSLYSTDPYNQIEVLRSLWHEVLNDKVVMMSLDNKVVHEILLKDEANRSMFEGKIKLTNQAGMVDFDVVSGKIVTEFTENDPEVLLHRSQNKIVKEYRKYWITEMFKRYMTNFLMNRADDVRLELGYDSELESELIGTVEQKTDRHTVYKVPRIGKHGVNADQIVDACRAMVDAIMTIDAEHYRETAPDLSAMLASFGYCGKPSSDGWRMPWDVR